MINIAFLVRYFVKSESANSVCANNIIVELQKKGCNVIIISAESDKAKCIPSANLFPVYFQDDDELCDLYYNKLEELSCERSFDIVIAAYYPRGSIIALKNYKLKHNSTKCIIYEFDSFADGIPQSIVPFLSNLKHEFLLKKVYSVIDEIVVMKSHEEYWLKKFGKRYGGKMKIADIPMLQNKNCIPVKNNNLSFIYAGLLSRKYRSPLYVVSLFSALEKELNFSFQLFCKGDYEPETLQLLQKSKSIFKKDYISHEELKKEYMKASFFVNIGNKLSNSVPSKIFDYFSYGKPIIHFAYNKNDSCLYYLDKYPLSLILDMNIPIEENINKMIIFINETKGKSVNFESIVDSFIMNTPQYSSKLLLD